MAHIAVEVQDVSKRFRLYKEKYSSLKEKMIHAGRVPYEDLWALRDINFEVNEGETVGILGRNGSGKSTLLKCVCGVLQPTSGQVVVRGKLAGLLELGAGFQEELSGRENVYLNGSMLGLSKRDIDAVFDDIVEFAELGQFIDNQVKFYSSGMYVRLGFAVAVNVDPDVLVVDEVLAVGDERFQLKCMDRIKEFQKDGRTILFVSHSPDLVRSICESAVVLSDGKMIGYATPGEAVRLFRERLLEANSVLSLGMESDPVPAKAPVRSKPPSSIGAGDDTESETGDRRPVRLTEVAPFFDAGAERHYLLPGETLVVRTAFVSSADVEGVTISLEVRDNLANVLFTTDTEIMGLVLNVTRGAGAVDWHFESLPLFDGAYDIAVGVSGPGGLYDWRERACSFEVVNPGRSNGRVAMPVRLAIVPREWVDDSPDAHEEPAAAER